MAKKSLKQVFPGWSLNAYPTTHRVITYAYDPLYRLTEAQYSTGERYRYAYDAVGNRLSLTTGGGVVHYAYDAANRLTGAGGQAYTWDVNGNLLSDGARSYSYDHAHRLVRVVSGTLTTEFVYNGAGDRVAKTSSSVTHTLCRHLLSFELAH